jgi:hypothetical protein
MNKTLGILLIALGLFGLAWGGFTYTTREKVVDIGPFTLLARKHTMYRCLPSSAVWHSLEVLCSWWQENGTNIPRSD